jgi:hypothetical protein
MMSLTAFEINSNLFDQNKRKTQTKLWCEIGTKSNICSHQSIAQ